MKQRNEADRQQFEKEKQDTLRLLEEASRKAVEQNKIVKKHERENKALEMEVQNQKKQLIERKQRLERYQQHVKEMLEIEKPTSEEDKDRMAKLESELEDLPDLSETLITKEREANDELEDARKAACQVLDNYGSKDKIGLKLMGCINKGPWEAASKKKFKCHADGWDLVMSKMISEWEDRTKYQNYYPFKMVQVGQGDEWKRVIDEDDEHMKQLKQDLGAEVMQTVAVALFEMEEYNASGRYPVRVAWDFQKNHCVLLKDLLLYVKELLDSGRAKKNKRVRAV